MPDSPSKPHSPEPWKQDARDRKTVLDGYARLVAVTTSREDAARIVAGVNAARGLGADGLAEAPMSDALQVLFEICLYHSDVKFRNHVDRRGGFASLVERADKAWRVFGEDAFHVDGASSSKESPEKEGTGDGASSPVPSGDGTAAPSPAEAARAAAAPRPPRTPGETTRKLEVPAKKNPASGSGK